MINKRLLLWNNLAGFICTHCNNAHCGCCFVERRRRWLWWNSSIFLPRCAAYKCFQRKQDEVIVFVCVSETKMVAVETGATLFKEISLVSIFFFAWQCIWSIDIHLDLWGVKQCNGSLQGIKLLIALPSKMNDFSPTLGRSICCALRVAPSGRFLRFVPCVGHTTCAQTPQKRLANSGHTWLPAAS
jgi:hypothetical protein